MRKLLATEPAELSEQGLETYRRIGALTVDNFEQAANKMNIKLEFNELKTEYRDWIDDYGWQTQGMVDKRSGRMHGIVRRQGPNDFGMGEAQFDEGRVHGLARTINRDGSYSVDFFREGMKHGVCTCYYADGSIQQLEIFEHGICVRTEIER